MAGLLPRQRTFMTRPTSQNKDEKIISQILGHQNAFRMAMALRILGVGHIRGCLER
jgi:hypothetical protein